MRRSSVVIAGAGPAGSALAIRLSAAGHRVSLVERESFPRDKLCGEFISPECFPHFSELGVAEEMFGAGGSRIHETVFFAASGRSVTVPSEWFGGHALSLSRARMDALLLARARNVGVEVVEGDAVSGLEFNDHSIVELRTRLGRELKGDIFIDATGRSRVLAKLISKLNNEAQTPPIRAPYVAFKTHLRDADIAPGRCEIHVFPGGYGGLSSIENGLANHCYIVSAASLKDVGGCPERILEVAVFQNPRARAALESAEPVSARLAVALTGYGSSSDTAASNLFSVGDASSFIDPFTGSGMLIAFDSVELLAKCIKENAETDAIRRAYQGKHRKAFAKRLRAASLLRYAAFRPVFAEFAIWAASATARGRRFLARATRGKITEHTG